MNDELDSDAVAELFELGSVRERARPAATGWGGHNVLWKLTTDTGVWAVKQIRRDLPDDVETPFAIERTAHEAGIPSPRPIPSRNGRCYETVSDTPMRCHSWEEGATKLNEDVDTADCERMGAIVAQLHGLRIPVETTSVRAAEPFTKAHWIELAAIRSSSWAAAINEHVDQLVSIDEKVQQRWAAMNMSQQVGSHNDLNAHNVLFDRGRLSVIDWDAAGPQFESFERASYPLLWSQRAGGGYDESRALAFMRGYVGTGGAYEDGDDDALWLWLRGVIWWTEQNVRLAIDFASEVQDINAKHLLQAVLAGPDTVTERQAMFRRCLMKLRPSSA